MGKTVYLTDLQIEMIIRAFDPSNVGFDGCEDGEERWAAAEDIVRKLEK